MHIRPEAPVGDDGPTVVDLFCGCGGFSCGFGSTGFNVLLGLDLHAPSAKTFKSNHPSSDVIVGNIKDVTEGMVLEAVGGRRVDVVTAGVPCQGFSLNNRKRWDDDERNFLFREFIRVVQILEPEVILLENVSGLRKAAHGAFEKEISEAIEQSGYDVQFNMLNAADYGVPQKRQRIFFLGARPGTEVWWPKPTHGDGKDRGHLTVWEAIGDLPQIESRGSASEYDTEPFSDYQREMRGECKKLLNHTAPSHPPEVIEKIRNTPPGQPMYPKFKQRIRLHPDQPSPTQVCGGIRPQFQFGHPKLSRGLTVRERCRTQSFPDHYEIFGGTVQGRVQTGNAVPPLLARAIGRQIVGMLNGNPRPQNAISAVASQMGLF